MPKIVLTKEDLLRGTVLKPGWYPVEIMDVTESQAQSDGSLNITIEMKVSSGESAGVPLYRLFNEKGFGFARRFLEALNAKIDPNKESQEFELANTKGKKLEAYVKNELWDGLMRNRVEDFRPSGGGV